LAPSRCADRCTGGGGVKRLICRAAVHRAVLCIAILYSYRRQ
jgi:hypothetical protein